MIAGCSLHNNNLLCKFLCWLRFNPLGLNLVILLTLILTFVMVDYHNCVSDRRTNRIQKWSLRIHSRYVHFVCENSKNPFLSKSSSQNLEVVVWTIVTETSPEFISFIWIMKSVNMYSNSKNLTVTPKWSSIKNWR